MSLFDVIKYPISHPPTVEELSALPEDLYIKWRDETFSIHPEPTIVWVAAYLKAVNLLYVTERLRRFIGDYEPL